ncbi:MAG: transposase, partial [Planctomycetaceae bacterium]
RDKTDCGDAALLADLLRVNDLPEVWLADETTRPLRRLVRSRGGLVEERQAVKLRLRPLLREERVDCETARAWTKAWFAWLDTVCLGEQSRGILDRDRQGNPELRAVLIQLAKRLPRQVERGRDLHARLRRIARRRMGRPPHSRTPPGLRLRRRMLASKAGVPAEFPNP